MLGKNLGYIRVSSIDQNIDRQLEGLKIDKVFIDKCSGKDTERPQLQLLLEFAREGDVLYIHSMDRLARNVVDLIRLVKQFNDKKVVVNFIKEGLNFSGNDTPFSKLQLTVIGAVAEFERELIRERQREGIALAKQSKTYKGRVKVLKPEQVEELRKMKAERYKVVDIAKHFGIGRMSVYRYLKG